MACHERLRALGLFDARVPRYTSYPPANHFARRVDGPMAARWMADLPPGSRISLYFHIPYCRQLCWFCACRTQGTTTDRPLAPYLGVLKEELNLVARNLPRDVTVSQIHLGGGTPTLLSSALLSDLGAALRDFRPWEPDLQFSVEVDPTEVDAERIETLAALGMNRASIGVQDFDPKVQQAIGRVQSFERTREVVDLVRAAGVRSLNMDVLYGLPHQTRARVADSVQRVLSLSPDRVALYGYAHVPWMAKRQIMIPRDALPGSELRLELFDTARRLFLWDGYREIGIDHFAREGDSLAEADRSQTLRRNFQGYTDDSADALIGIGASAISHYPQGYAQNHPTSSRYARAIGEGRLATERGHELSADDALRGAMIESLMCRFELDLPALTKRFGRSVSDLREMTACLRDRFAEVIDDRNDRIRLVECPRLVARLAANELDAYFLPEGRHSRAL